MSDIILVVAVYVGIGVVWLSMVRAVSRRQFEYVSPKESAVHILGWPYVFVELKLWWLGLPAAATLGATAFAGVDH